MVWINRLCVFILTVYNQLIFLRGNLHNNKSLFQIQSPVKILLFGPRIFIVKYFSTNVRFYQ